MPESTDIQVNGSSRSISPGCTVENLLAELQLDTTGIAVELNRQILPRRDYGTTLQGGDQLEIVTFVGGG
jgi:thiamine biosynthesis protein ThiS